jgi:DNA-binding response OmpR family regulator
MRKILIVEDEPLLRETYQLILSTQPFTIHTAENGKVALEKCAQEEYDLILLDLMMPLVNGVEFMEKFMPGAPSKTRVIIMSNLSAGTELERAMQLGAVQSALKASLGPKDLISMVRYDLEAS